MKSVEKLYQNLGKLFYAVAAADNIVREEEIKALRNLVRQEWIDVDDLEDEFGSDAAYQIEFLFDWMDETKPEASDVFEEFREFKESNEDLFTPRIKKLILKTADSIATSFAGKNKSELIMLSKLKAIL